MNDRPLRPQPGRPGVYRHEGVPCPACGKYLDAMADTDRGRSREAADGDFVVCVRCGVVSILVVGALGVAFREPTPDELDEFMRDYRDVVARRSEWLRDLRKGPAANRWLPYDGPPE